MANNNTPKQRRGFKEFVRKFFVSLKRNPSMIPMLATVASFLVFSLNLASISNTTVKINSTNLGQCEFIGMLLSILTMVVFLNCFPKRQKPNFIMIAIYFVMTGVLIFVDTVYLSRINTAISDPETPFDPTGADSFILTAQSVLTIHVILLIVCIALVALLPIYSKLIKKINTSIDVEGNEDMAAIELTDDAD
ncbi:MAG: hypothetical protein ACI4JY_01565 [Oscillospiraceae bacterium]